MNIIRNKPSDKEILKANELKTIIITLYHSLLIAQLFTVYNQKRFKTCRKLDDNEKQLGAKQSKQHYGFLDYIRVIAGKHILALARLTVVCFHCRKLGLLQKLTVETDLRFQLSIINNLAKDNK